MLTMLRKVLASIGGQLGTLTKETTKMIKDISMEKCSGLMEVFIRASGSMEFKMGLATC